MKTRTICTLLCALALLPAALQAQTNTENFSQFEFNFNNPGARAAALGGAFIPLADDATAAEANPAGLTALLQSEFSFELKSIQFRQRVQNFGFRGTPEQFQNEERTFENAVISPAFASLVLPAGKVTFSAFRHELVNFEASFFTRGAYVPNYPDGPFSLFPVRSALDMQVTNIGAAAGFKLSPALSVGVSAGVSSMQLKSDLERFALEIFDSQTRTNRSVIDDRASDSFVNLGLLYKANEKVTVGLIYKKRPTFTIEHQFSTRGGTDRKEIRMNIPSSFGAGIAIRPNESLTLAFDAVQVNYSALTSDFVLTIEDDLIDPADYAAEDGLELHFGAEYVTFVRNFGVVLRGGAYLEPDSRIRWTGEGRTGSSSLERRQAEAIGRFLFREGESELHGTFGLGLLLQQNLQLDLAANLSSGSNEGVASFVIRF